MKQIHWLPLLSLLVITGCLTTGGHRDDEDDETEIALDQVPDKVLAAARKAVPGLEIEEAVTEVEDGKTIYTLEGEANSKEYEVEVDANGKVLEVEEEDEDDDEDDDGD